MAVKVRVAGVREDRAGMTRVHISPSSGLDSANPLPYGDAALPLNGSLCCTLTSLSDAVLLSGFTFGACGQTLVAKLFSRRSLSVFPRQRFALKFLS